VVQVGFQLTQKEQLLLKDQSSHEKICIEKYTNYAEQAQDPQLKQLFNQFGSQEQQHYNTINQLLQGQQVNVQAGQGQQQGQQAGQGMSRKVQQSPGGQGTAGMTMQNDAMLCNDMLMTEKYVSGTYDTAIFESVNPNIRQALQYIQKEEQQHGEGIFNYMQQHGMYNPK
jgi:spore coat protein CotF